MELDVQPVATELDIQPVAADASGGLDLQPVAPQISVPTINPNGPGGFNYGGAAKTPRPLTGPELGAALAQGAREAAAQSVTPFVDIPRSPQQQATGTPLAVGFPGVAVPSPEIAAGIYNAAAGFGEFMESPLGVATMGAGSIPSAVVKRAMAGAFAGDMAHHVPAAAQAAGAASVNGTVQQQTEADLNLAANVLLPGVLGKEALAGKTTAPAAKAAAAAPKAEFSEFGGDQTTPLQTPAVSASQPAETLDVQPAAAVKAQAAGETVPELTETLAAQMDALHAGKRPAVLFTHPDQAIPDWATKGKDGQFEVHDTPAGRFLYDTAQLTKDQIDQAVNDDRVGDVLGYGIARKPADADLVGAVVVRKPNGVEKQAVATDAQNLPSVMQAAQRLASPGDTITLEKPEDVIAKRQPTAVQTPEQIRLAQVQENVQAVKALAASRQNALDVQPIAEAAADATPSGEPVVKPVPVTITPAEYTAARQGLGVGAPVALAQGVAKDAKRAQLFAEAVSTERPGQTEPMPANQLFVGDEFKLAGQPVKVEEQVTDAETGQPSHVRVSGAYGDQFIPADQMVHMDQGTLSSPGLGAAILNKLDSLKMDTNGQLHAFGLLPEIWNQLVEGVKLAVRGGMALKDAIDAGIAKMQASGQAGSAFDAAGARQHLLENLGERATGIKVDASQQISDETKAQITNWTYEKRTNAADAAVADGLVKQFGVDAAIETFNHPPANFPEAVRSQLIRSIGRELAAGEKMARSQGHTMAADALAKKAGRFWDDALARSTELAQGLQAMRAVTDFSPEAVVARTRMELDKAAQHELNKVTDQTTTMKQALDEGRAAGAEDVRQDAEVNTAARAAVDEAVKADPAVHQAVVMELAEPWARSEVILNKAREVVAAKVNDILNKAPRPPGLTAGQHFRQIADDLAKRAAGIFAGHIQGGEPGVPLVDKLMQRLGLERGKAVQLATSLSKEWDAQLNLAKKKLDARLAWQRIKQLKREAEAQTDPLVDQAIRRALREKNVKLGDALRQAAGDRDALGKHIADRVLERSGLKGAAADQLRDSLKRRWDALVSDGQRRALEAMANRAGVKLTPKMKSAFDKLVEIDRFGGLTDGKFLETVKTAMKLKQLTAEDAAKLKDLVTAAQSKPEGFLRDQAAAEVLKLTEKLKGEVTWRDVPLAIFYANVLSGFTTPLKIAVENMNLLASSTVASFLARPREVMNPPDFVRAVAGAYKRGIVKGGLQAQGTLRSGVVSGIWDSPRHTGVLEMKPFGEKLEPLNFWKWFTRGISTAHELTFKPSWEIRQTLMAREIGRKEGLTGKALDQRVANLLANTPEEAAKARAQALTELPAGNRLDVERRTREILERVREDRMPGSTENARDFALRTAYLNEPYGLLGTLATGVRSVLEKARKEFPVAGTAAKTQIPFTTVVANILNEKLNWTPVGLVRAAASQKTGELYGREIIDPHERAELYAKALVGTAVIGATAELFGQHIHGNGPADPNKRKQLQAAGWIPHSIEYGGRYYSYMNTPAALGLAIIGNTMDWNRYGHGEQADGMARLAFVTKATAQAIVSQGMLDSLRRFFEVIGSEDTSDGAGKLEKLTARTAGSFVVPNVVNQVDRMFDPTVYDAQGAKALVMSQIPFVRRDNRPVLNVLGEPIQSAPFHYWESKATDDVLWRVLTAQQAFVPTPAREQIIGKKNSPDARAMTPDEYYEWIAESGPAIRERLEENLDTIATSEPAEAKKLVVKYADEERAKAKPQF